MVTGSAVDDLHVDPRHWVRGTGGPYTDHGALGQRLRQGQAQTSGRAVQDTALDGRSLGLEVADANGNVTAAAARMPPAFQQTLCLQLEW